MPHTLVVSGGEAVLCTRPTITNTSGGKESLGFLSYGLLLSFFLEAWLGKSSVVLNEFLQMVFCLFHN